MADTYQLLKDKDGTENGAVLRTRDGIISVVPAAADNIDYQQYLQWVADGNTPDPA